MCGTSKSPTLMPLTDISKTTDTSNAGTELGTETAAGSCSCCAPQQQTIDAQPLTPGGMSSVYSVSGLTCGSCAGRISKAINALDGVQDVQIALVPGGTSTVSVTSNQPLAPASVQNAVEKAGYQLTTA